MVHTTYYFSDGWTKASTPDTIRKYAIVHLKKRPNKGHQDIKVDTIKRVSTVTSDGILTRNRSTSKHYGTVYDYGAYFIWENSKGSRYYLDESGKTIGMARK